MTIYILIETRNNEELRRLHFRSRGGALLKAGMMMDESLPKRRKTRKEDIDRAMAELDRDGYTGYSMLYSEYRIEEAELY